MSAKKLTWVGLNELKLFLYTCNSQSVGIRAVESEFKSNPIFPIFFSDFPISSDFLSDFYPIFSAF